MHESLRLYNICKFMEWAQLPNGPGIYAQHPKFLDDIMVIAVIDSKVEKRKHEIEMAKNKK